LTSAKSLFTPPKANEESTYEEFCIFNKEQLGEQETEEDNEELQHDLSEEQRAYEILIEQWFQVSTRLDQFRFCFYSVKLQS
jgi:hypothetical protein